METIDKILAVLGFIVMVSGAAITTSGIKNRDPYSIVSGCAVGGLGIRYALKHIQNDEYIKLE